MIACFIEEGQTSVRVLKEAQEVCSFLGTTVRVVSQQYSVYLRIPHSLRYMIKNPIKHGSKLVLENQDTGCIGTICFSAYDKGYTRYRFLKRTKDIITIGSTIDCDLYLQDANLGHVITLDWSNHELIDPGSMFFPSGTRSFRAGDRVLILNLVLVFHDDFLMINEVENLYTSLPAYVPPMIREPLAIKAIETHAARFRAPVLDGSFHEELAEPLPMKDRTFQPLRFTIGPALLMSTAALANGILSSFRMYGTLDLEKSLSMLLFPCVMILSVLLFHPMQRRYERKQIRRHNCRREEEYDRYLRVLEKRIEEKKDGYARELHSCFPWPDEPGFQDLLKQKTIFQKDFLIVRIGDAEVPFDLVLKQSFRFALDDPLTQKVEELKNRCALIHVPVLLDCSRRCCVALVGCGWNLVMENLMYQICATVENNAVHMLMVADRAWVKEHDWVYQIPHLYDESGVRRLIVDPEDARRINGILKQRPQEHILVFAQDQRILSLLEIEKACVIVGVDGTVIPSFCDSYYVCSENPCFYSDGHLIQLDRMNWKMTLPWMDLPLLQEPEHNEKSKNAFLKQFDVQQIEDLKIAQRWKETMLDEHLLARIGMNEEQETAFLDLSEKGNGPHGLIAGTTGSGKSEFILSMILSLALEYSPERLNFILIDFKGGRCAHALSEKEVPIPHVAGVLSNLDSGRIDRALVSFRNECRFRQNQFHQLSLACDQNISSLSLYRKARLEHPEFTSLADLVIIVDEFAELKKEYPEFMSELISIARIGRSLGIHLILSTQRPMGVVDEQIWSNSRFKICLKVQEPQDSKELLHRPDAAWIQKPGEYYLLCDDSFRHGQSAYTGDPARGDSNEVLVLDSMAYPLTVYRSDDHESATLAYELVHLILQEGKHQRVKARSIWKPEPERVSITQMPDEAILYLGIADDYHNNRHIWTGWDPILDAHAAVFSDSKAERCSFLRLFLREWFRTAGCGDEIAVVDESCWLKEEVIRCNAVLRSERALRMYLRHVVQIERTVTIVFTDLASFLRQSQNSGQMLHDLVTMKCYERVHVVVLAATYQMIPYRDYGFFSRRIALATKSTVLLSGVFETGVKTIVQPGHALVMEEYFLQVALALCTMEDLENSRAGSRSSDYVFPFVDDIVRPMIFSDGRHLLGLGVETDSWITARPGERVVILASSQQEAENSADDRFLIAVTSGSILEKKEEPDQSDHVLVVGKAAERYAPELFVRRKRTEQSAVYIHDGRKEMIELVRPWKCGDPFVFLLCADVDGS